MDGAIFGSYSLTEFIDLYDLNLRNNHHYSLFFEVDHEGIVRLHQGKIDGLSKINQQNYLIGILCGDMENVSIESTWIDYFESKFKKDISYLIDAKKEFVYFTYENSKVTFTSTKTIRFYMSENGSFSTFAAPGYRVITPSLVHSIPLFKDKNFITDRREYGY